MTIDPDTRDQLLEAFRREGIRYPEERLPAAEKDYADLRRFLELIRAEAKDIRAREF